MALGATKQIFTIVFVANTVREIIHEHPSQKQPLTLRVVTPLKLGKAELNQRGKMCVPCKKRENESRVDVGRRPDSRCSCLNHDLCQFKKVLVVANRIEVGFVVDEQTIVGVEINRVGQMNDGHLGLLGKRPVTCLLYTSPSPRDS